MKLAIKLRRSDEEIIAKFATLHTRADVADLLEVSDAYLRRILYVRQEPKAYRAFFIKKRSGGQRKISAPPNALSILQSKLNHVFQLGYKRKRAAHGFVRGRSILTNAAMHVGKRWVLNVDLADFFPSINFGRVRGMLLSPPYSLGAAAATVIAQLCCTDDGLPQGAPSSPMIANMVCGRLDGELGALARKHHAAYTRYGDDITISLRRYAFPEELAIAPTGWLGSDIVVGASLRQIIESNGFALNPDKTRLQFRDCRQEVTGIGVNVFPNVNRTLIREVRAMLHAWDRYGLDDAEREFREHYAKLDRNPELGALSFKRVLKGKLDFIQMVRGRSDPVYVKLRETLHQLEPTLVSPPPAALPRSDRSVRGIGADPGWTRWYHRLGQSVFHLQIETVKGISSGTAFAYRRTNLATAAHNLVGDVRVALGTQLIQVSDWTVHDHFYSHGVDCATVAFDHGASPLRVNPQIPVPGEAVAVIGFASVPQRHPSLGIYTGTVESITDNYYGTRLIQITVASAGGLSGSPVIDTAGQTIGLVVESTFEQTQDGVPGREFCAVLPIERVSELGRPAASGAASGRASTTG